MLHYSSYLQLFKTKSYLKKKINWFQQLQYNILSIINVMLVDPLFVHIILAQMIRMTIHNICKVRGSNLDTTKKKSIPYFSLNKCSKKMWISTKNLNDSNFLWLNYRTCHFKIRHKCSTINQSLAYNASSSYLFSITVKNSKRR